MTASSTRRVLRQSFLKDNISHTEHFAPQEESVWNTHIQARFPSRPFIPASGLGTVALVLSESKFTIATLTQALGSNSPFSACTYFPSVNFPRSARLNRAQRRSYLLSRIPLLVERKVFFVGNEVFNENLIQFVLHVSSARCLLQQANPSV
ncbi:hypothetical protein BDR07DRAFT_1390437 [Suillus spraguei]|nr:hypothetical protein BDR07DRAFT_1390437 [Suillus spraguei]